MNVLTGLLLPSNLLTMSRIVVVPLVITIWLLGTPESRLAAAILFIVAGMTDMVDGWLARHRNEETRFGAFLDPVADKVLVAATLLLVVQHPPFNTKIWPGLLLVPAVIIVGRDIAMSALRELAARLQRASDLKVTFFAKCKTVLEMVAVGGLLVAGYDPLWLQPVVFVMSLLGLNLAALMSLWTLGMYIFQARRWLAGSKTG